MNRTDSYSMGALSHQVPTELDRLRQMEAVLDPLTTQCLKLIDPGEDQNCQEIFTQLQASCAATFPACADAIGRALDLFPETEFADLPGIAIAVWGRTDA